MKIRSVKYNFVMNVILTASTFIFPLITFPYISRILLPAGVGKVNFATSFVSYFSMIAMLGVPTYGIRACAQVRDDREELSRTVHEIFLINLLVGALAYMVYFAALVTVPRLRADTALFAVMSSTILFNVIGMEWLYKGLEQYSYITIRSIAFKAIGLILMFLFVKDQSDYVIYGAISIVAGVGSNVLNFLKLPEIIDLHPVGHYNLQRHWKVIMVFFMMSVATTIYTNLDTVMLGFMKDDVEVGYYTASVKVKTILVSFVTALSTVLLPRVSYYIEQGMEDKFREVSQKALNFVAVAAVPVVVYFTLYAKESILLLSGTEFMGSVVPMQIIMPTVLFIGITNVLGIQILVPLGKEKEVCISVIVGAVVDLIINAICIPRMASAGAALGTVIAEFTVLVVQCVMLKGQIRMLTGKIQWLKIVIAVSVAAVLCTGIKYLQIGTFLTLCFSWVIFAVVYGSLLLVMKENFVWNIVEEVWKKIRVRR